MELPLGIRRITTPLPTRPGPRPLVPAAGRGRLDARRHRHRPARRAGGLGRLARRRRGGADLHHPLPPRSRRRGGRRRRADGSAGQPGRARLRAVRARLGQPELAPPDRRLVRHPRRPERDHRGADQLRERLPALHPLPARSGARRRRRHARRLGARRRARATPTASSACSRSGVLVSADHLLGRISPTVGLWPASRPDPLGDFLESLERTIELAPEIALPGHGDPIADPVGRAHELIEHHRERLAFTESSARRSSAHGLRGLARPLRRRSEARIQALRRRGDAVAPRAARARGARRAARR